MMSDASAIASAWQALERRQAEKAERLSLALVSSGSARLDEVPLAQCWAIRARHLVDSGERPAAATLLLNSLATYPNDPLAQALLIRALQEEVAARRNGMKGLHDGSQGTAIGNGRLILGMGTGRSGSTSLTWLLQAQIGTYCSHEHPPILPWAAEVEPVLFHLRRFELMLQLFDWVADVSHWWLPLIPRIVESSPGVRIVVLKRDKAETVDSFLRMKGGDRRGAINHWTSHDGTIWARNAWDPCYPKFSVNSVRSGIERYWDYYYQETDRLTALYPNNVRAFGIEALNERGGQKEILDFCGFDESVTLNRVHANRGHGGDGIALWPNPILQPVS